MSPSDKGQVADQGDKWRDLRIRLVSSAVLVPVAGACIWYGGVFYFVLVVAAMLGILVEWAGLFKAPLASWRGVLYVACPMASIAAVLNGQWDGAFYILTLGFVLGSVFCSGAVVAGIGGLSLLWLRFVVDPGGAAVLFLVAVVIASDSCAYLAGRIIGGAKLAPSISPGKTRSGAVGGLLGALLAGMVVAVLFPVEGQAGAVWRGAVFGGILGAVAQCGDLLESALKRRCGVKDSGSILPGHGGLLDRLDGLLLAAPVAVLMSLGVPWGMGFWYLHPADIIGRGGQAHPLSTLEHSRLFPVKIWE